MGKNRQEVPGAEIDERLAAYLRAQDTIPQGTAPGGRLDPQPLMESLEDFLSAQGRPPFLGPQQVEGEPSEGAPAGVQGPSEGAEPGGRLGVMDRLRRIAGQGGEAVGMAGPNVMGPPEVPPGIPGVGRGPEGQAVGPTAQPEGPPRPEPMPATGLPAEGPPGTVTQQGISGLEPTPEEPQFGPGSKQYEGAQVGPALSGYLEEHEGPKAYGTYGFGDTRVPAEQWEQTHLPKPEEGEDVPIDWARELLVGPGEAVTEHAPGFGRTMAHIIGAVGKLGNRIDPTRAMPEGVTTPDLFRDVAGDIAEASANVEQMFSPGGALNREGPTTFGGRVGEFTGSARAFGKVWGLLLRPFQPVVNAASAYLRQTKLMRDVANLSPVDEQVLGQMTESGTGQYFGGATTRGAAGAHALNVGRTEAVIANGLTGWLLGWGLAAGQEQGIGRASAQWMGDYTTSEIGSENLLRNGIDPQEAAQFYYNLPGDLLDLVDGGAISLLGMTFAAAFTPATQAGQTTMRYPTGQGQLSPPRPGARQPLEPLAGQVGPGPPPRTYPQSPVGGGGPGYQRPPYGTGQPLEARAPGGYRWEEALRTNETPRITRQVSPEPAMLPPSTAYMAGPAGASTMTARGTPIETYPNQNVEHLGVGSGRWLRGLEEAEPRTVAPITTVETPAPGEVQPTEVAPPEMAQAEAPTARAAPTAKTEPLPEAKLSPRMDISEELANRPRIPRSEFFDQPGIVKHPDEIIVQWPEEDIADAVGNRVLIPLDMIVPSHLFDHGGMPINPEFPIQAQGRDYHTNKRARADILKRAQKADENILLDPTAGVGRGPPVINAARETVAGHNRVGILIKALKNDPAFRDRYRDKLVKNWPEPMKAAIEAKYEGDPSKVWVEARLVDDEAGAFQDVRYMQRLNYGSDVSEARAKSPQEEAMEFSTRLKDSPVALDHFANTFDPQETLLEYLGGSYGSQFIKYVEEEGRIPKSQIAAYVDENGNLNAAGKALMQNTFELLAYGDPARIAKAPAGIKRKLHHVVVPMMQAGKVEGFDLAPLVLQAFDVIKAFQSHNADLAKTGNKAISFEQWRESESMSLGAELSHNFTPFEYDFAAHLNSGATNLLKSQFRHYAELAQSAGKKEGQGLLLQEGAAVTPGEALQMAFGMTGARWEAPLGGQPPPNPKPPPAEKPDAGGNVYTKPTGELEPAQWEVGQEIVRPTGRPGTISKVYEAGGVRYYSFSDGSGYAESTLLKYNWEEDTGGATVRDKDANSIITPGTMLRNYDLASWLENLTKLEVRNQTENASAAVHNHYLVLRSMKDWKWLDTATPEIINRVAEKVEGRSFGSMYESQRQAVIAALRGTEEPAPQEYVSERDKIQDVWEFMERAENDGLYDMILEASDRAADEKGYPIVSVAVSKPVDTWNAWDYHTVITSLRSKYLTQRTSYEKQELIPIEGGTSFPVSELDFYTTVYDYLTALEMYETRFGEEWLPQSEGAEGAEVSTGTVVASDEAPVELAKPIGKMRVTVKGTKYELPQTLEGDIYWWTRSGWGPDMPEKEIYKNGTWTLAAVDGAGNGLYKNPGHAATQWAMYYQGSGGIQLWVETRSNTHTPSKPPAGGKWNWAAVKTGELVGESKGPELSDRPASDKTREFRPGDPKQYGDPGLRKYLTEDNVYLPWTRAVLEAASGDVAKAVDFMEVVRDLVANEGAKAIQDKPGVNPVIKKVAVEAAKEHSRLERESLGGGTQILTNLKGIQNAFEREIGEPESYADVVQGGGVARDLRKSSLAYREWLEGKSERLAAARASAPISTMRSYPDLVRELARNMGDPVAVARLAREIKDELRWMGSWGQPVMFSDIQQEMFSGQFRGPDRPVEAGTASSDQAKRMYERLMPKLADRVISPVEAKQLYDVIQFQNWDKLMSQDELKILTQLAKIAGELPTNMGVQDKQDTRFLDSAGPERRGGARPAHRDYLDAHTKEGQGGLDRLNKERGTAHTIESINEIEAGMQRRSSDIGYEDVSVHPKYKAAREAQRVKLGLMEDAVTPEDRAWMDDVEEILRQPDDTEIAGADDQIGDRLTGTKEPEPGTPRIRRAEVVRQVADVTRVANEILNNISRPTTLQWGRVNNARARGWYSDLHKLIRVGERYNLPTTMHEMGHALEFIIYPSFTMMNEKGTMIRGNPWIHNRIEGMPDDAKIAHITEKAQAQLVTLGKALYGDRRPAGGYKREGWAEFTRIFLSQEIGPNESGRVIVTDVAGNRQDVTDIHTWLTDKLMVEHPKIAESLYTAKEAVHRWRYQGSLARNRPVDEKGVPITEDVKGKLAYARARVSDVGWRIVTQELVLEEFQPLYDLVSTVIQEQEKVVPAYKDPYLVAEQFRMTHTRIARTFVEDVPIDIAGNPVAPFLSLKDIISILPDADPTTKAIAKEYGINKADARHVAFSIYLYANRAVALLNDPGGARNPGMSLEDANFLVNKLGSEERQIAAGNYYLWWDSVLRYTAQASPVFTEVYARVLARDPGRYAPITRFLEENPTILDDYLKVVRGTGSSGGSRSQVKKLKGSGAEVFDPLYQTVRQVESMIHNSHRRAVLDRIFEMIRTNPELSHLATEVPRDKLPLAYRSTGEMLETSIRRLAQLGLEASESQQPRLAKAGEQAMLATETVNEFMEEFANDLDLFGDFLTIWGNAIKPKAGEVDPIMPYWDGNKIRWYQMDENMYRSVEGLEIPTTKSLGASHPYVQFPLDVFGMVARGFRLGTTGVRPAFGLITNPTRDLQTFFMNTRSMKYAPQLFATYMKALGEVFKHNLLGIESPWIEMFDRFGLGMAQPLGQDIKHAKRAVRQLMEPNTFGKRIIYYRFHPGWLAQDLIDGLRDVVQWPESIPRIAEMMEIGELLDWEPFDKDGNPTPIDFVTRLRFSQGASQATTDFRAGGRLSRAWNTIVAFHTAAWMGPRANLRALRRGYRRSRQARAGTDPKQRANIDWQYEDYGGGGGDKGGDPYPPSGKAGDWRRGLRSNTFLTRIMWMTSLYLGHWWGFKDEDWWKNMTYREKFAYFYVPMGDDVLVKIPVAFEPGYFSMMFVAMADAAYQQDPRMMTEWAKRAFRATAPPFVPTALEEVWEQATNRDTYWRTPINPQENWPSQGEPWEQFSDYNSRLSKDLGKVFNVSPRRIEHAMEGIWGASPTDALRAIEEFADVLGLGENIRRRPWELADIPVAGTLFRRGGQAGYRSQPVEDLYDRYEELGVRTSSMLEPPTQEEANAYRWIEHGVQWAGTLSWLRRYVSTTRQRSGLSDAMARMARLALDNAKAGTPFPPAATKIGTVLGDIKGDLKVIRQLEAGADPELILERIQK